MANGSLSQFKATLARKLERNQKRQARSDRYSKTYKSTHTKPEFDSPKLSKSELNKVKGDIRKKLKSDNKKQLINVIVIFAIITLIVSCLIFYMISFITKNYL